MSLWVQIFLHVDQYPMMHCIHTHWAQNSFYKKGYTIYMYIYIYIIYTCFFMHWMWLNGSDKRHQFKKNTVKVKTNSPDKVQRKVITKYKVININYLTILHGTQSPSRTVCIYFTITVMGLPSDRPPFSLRYDTSCDDLTPGRRANVWAAQNRTEPNRWMTRLSSPVYNRFQRKVTLHVS